MRKIFIGGFLLVSGVLLYIGIHISTTILMTEINGWSTPPGRFGTALKEIGGKTKVIISILLCSLGIILMFWDEGRIVLTNRRKRNKINEKTEDEKILV